jgi:hypothetical protein
VATATLVAALAGVDADAVVARSPDPAGWRTPDSAGIVLVLGDDAFDPARFWPSDEAVSESPAA